MHPTEMGELGNPGLRRRELAGSSLGWKEAGGSNFDGGSTASAGRYGRMTATPGCEMRSTTPRLRRMEVGGSLLDRSPRELGGSRLRNLMQS